MKNPFQSFCICALLATISATSFAQKLSVGQFSGTNFSNLHGNLTVNKWEPKQGPSNGLFVEYDFSKLFSLQAEVNYLTHYYEEKYYRDTPSNEYIYFYSDLSSSCSIYPNPVYQSGNVDFSFLRFPLVLKYKTPTRLQLGIGGGVFYALLMDDDLTKKERDVAEKADQNIYPPTHDWGYLLSADLSYPITRDVKIFLNGRLSTGQKVFLEDLKGKNGATELLFGIKYSPRLNKNSQLTPSGSTASDSTFLRCYIKPVVGGTRSWNSGNSLKGNYSHLSGSHAGLIFGYRLDKTVSLQTGFQFQQKGYSFSDSSFVNHRYSVYHNVAGRKVDSQVTLDYLTIPLNLSFSFGNKFAFYFDFGMYADLLLNARCTGTVTNEYFGGSSYRHERQTLNDAVEGYYKSADFGVSTGLGFLFPVTEKIKFDMGLHYARGLKNILEKPDFVNNDDFTGDLSFKNASLAVQFGIQILLPN